MRDLSLLYVSIVAINVDKLQCIIITYFLLGFTNGMKDFLDNFENIVPHFLFYNYTVDQNQIAVVTQKIMEYYFPNGKNSNDLAQVTSQNRLKSTFTGSINILAHR